MTRINNYHECLVSDLEDLPVDTLQACQQPVQPYPEPEAVVLARPFAPRTFPSHSLFRPIDNMSLAADKMAQALAPYGLDYNAGNEQGVLLRIRTQEIYKALPASVGEDVDIRARLAAIEYLNESIKALPHPGLSEMDVFTVASHLMDNPQDYQTAIRENKPLNLILADLKTPVVDPVVEAYSYAFERSYPVPHSTLSIGNYLSDHLRKAASAVGLPFDGDDDATTKVRVAIWEQYKLFGNIAGTVTDQNVEAITQRAARSVLRAQLYDQLKAAGLNSEEIAASIDSAMAVIIASHQIENLKPPFAQNP